MTNVKFSFKNKRFQKNLKEFRKLLKSSKAFSLIELMVVVGIIAILSTIAIPQYQNFQVKSRQKEAQSLLSGYYIAAQAAKVEHGGYVGNFSDIGYTPGGQLKYRITSQNNDDISKTLANDGEDCIATNVFTSANCPKISQTWEEILGALNSKVGVWTKQLEEDPTVESNNFIVIASGVINVTGKTQDEWAINERKLMANQCDGVRESGKATCTHGTKTNFSNL